MLFVRMLISCGNLEFGHLSIIELGICSLVNDIWSWKNAWFTNKYETPAYSTECLCFILFKLPIPDWVETYLFMHQIQYSIYVSFMCTAWVLNCPVQLWLLWLKWIIMWFLNSKELCYINQQNGIFYCSSMFLLHPIHSQRRLESVQIRWWISYLMIICQHLFGHQINIFCMTGCSASMIRIMKNNSKIHLKNTMLAIMRPLLDENKFSAPYTLV